MTEPRTNSSRDGNTLDTLGAPSTMSSVIPVSSEMRGGTAHPGSTSDLELAQALSALVLGHGDLGQRRCRGRAAGGLHVHDGETHLEERVTQIDSGTDVVRSGAGARVRVVATSPCGARGAGVGMVAVSRRARRPVRPTHRAQRVLAPIATPEW